ncbi:TPR end-of-group domain-containing protein [Rhodospirillum sp. A1_3_36]|uniref:TPR end-of-group domain-containing protein n=1 Tax=Rhodospirillum sp. A1_3_36 TaxID=3391666 RepID=UPI0039A40AAF
MRVKEVTDYIRTARDITFIIGAGASKSAGIPLAWELVERINAEYGHCLGHLSPDDRKHYGKVMHALSPRVRQDLIQPYLDGSRMNWGHIALACVIQASQVRRILTFNFDFLLERATALLGDHLPVYDFGVSPTREIQNLSDKAIFHLHGQSYGLKLLNSEQETKAHAEAIRPVVEDSIRHHLTIVIGYSGEADAAFDVMAESFDSRNDFIWLGYDKEPKRHLKPLLDKDYTAYAGGCDFDRTMIKIATGLGCWPPLILTNPPAHVLGQLAPLPDYPVSDDLGVDTLSDTRIRLEEDANTWERGRSGVGNAAEDLMSGLSSGQATLPEDMTEEERILRAWIFVEYGNRLFDEARGLSGEARAAKLREAGKKYTAAIAIKPDMHEAFNNWGNALSMEAEGLSGEARASKFREAGEKYAVAIGIKPDEQEPFTNWGNALSEEARGLSGEARVIKFRKAYEKYTAAVGINPDEQEPFYNWGNALSEEARGLSGEARAATFRESYEKYAAAIGIKPDLHEAFNNWGAALSDEAKDLSGEARVDKFRKSYEKYTAAVEIKPDYHEALYNWGNALSEEAQGLSGEARAANFRESNEKYADAVGIKRDKCEAFSNWGTALLEEAGELSGEARLDKLREAEERTREASRLSGKPNYNLACLFALRGETEDALDILEDCAAQGTLPDAEHLAKDADMDSLRSHPRFQALVEAVASKA